MKGLLIYYRPLDKKGMLTQTVIDKIIDDFTKKMNYAPNEIVARSDEVVDDVRSKVTEVTKGCPPGHVIVYPLIERLPRVYYGNRSPV